MARAASIALMFFLVTLAGCAENGNGEDPGPTVIPDPSATFTATPTNGSTPLLVNFTFTFSDVNGRTVTWSLDADADGTADGDGTVTENGTIHHEHTYATDGEYNASATITFNGTSSLLGPITITVAEGYTLQTATKSGVMEYENCEAIEDYIDDELVPDAGEANDTVHRMDIKVNGDTRRQTYEVAWDFNVSFHEVHTFFTTKNGTVVKHETGAGPAGEPVTTHGTVDRDAYWAVLFACGGDASFDVTYTTPRPSS